MIQEKKIDFFEGQDAEEVARGMSTIARRYYGGRDAAIPDLLGRLAGAGGCVGMCKV
jgi:hypothetical protein